MKKQLKLSIGQHSSAGRKPINQDFHAAFIPELPILETKGVVVALADGISSSDVSQIASETAIKGFIEDYYCTSESWSVKNSAHRVLKATNSWLNSQTQQSPYRFDKNKGYVCTFSAAIFKSNSVHLFHVGDCRIYRFSNNHLEKLTHDHRKVVSDSVSYLSKGLGIHDYLEVDYHVLPLQLGDVFILASDGAYEYLTHEYLINKINSVSDNLDDVAKDLLDQAYGQGSDDNLTIQIVRVDTLADYDFQELHSTINALPSAAMLQVGKVFEGYEVLRELYISSRSHVYLALDNENQKKVVIKTPSTEMRNNPKYLEQFVMEDWVAQRLDSPYVVKAVMNRPRHSIYTVTEFVEGKTLAQWMIDNPLPSIDIIRNIIEQIAKGLQAFHRQEMIHQDLRPNNIMIDDLGRVKIIDLASTKIAGVHEIIGNPQEIVGTAQYTAPEYFLGHEASSQSDLFSLGVITYQLFSNHLPYGNKVAHIRSTRDLQRLSYRSLSIGNIRVPGWIDFAIKKACELHPNKRYEHVSEFIYDLKHPNSQYLSRPLAPLIEREPERVWQAISFLLLCLLIYQFMI